MHVCKNIVTATETAKLNGEQADTDSNPFTSDEPEDETVVDDEKAGKLS